MGWDFESITCNEAASSVLREAQHWTDVVQELGRQPPKMHIYTDGSAAPTKGQSGYAVVILLQVGAAVALIGVPGRAADGRGGYSMANARTGRTHG